MLSAIFGLLDGLLIGLFIYIVIKIHMLNKNKNN
jgi:hypothetical protein